MVIRRKHVSDGLRRVVVRPARRGVGSIPDLLDDAGPDRLAEEPEPDPRAVLETAFRAFDLQPGMRLLDIGAGWGGVFEYGCPRGIHVTGVTTFEDSYRYVKDLIQRNNFSGEIILQDFLTYHPQEPFDAVVIYGVIEHIPYYRRFFERVWECLKPGGKIYIDGSASKEKYSLSQFARRYLWQGAHSCMCLQEVIREAMVPSSAATWSRP